MKRKRRVEATGRTFEGRWSRTPGEQFIYLSWGDVAEDGGFTMFRRAKVMLNAIDPRLLQMARAGGTLSGSFSLMEMRSLGGPVCAAMRPPQIEWTVSVG